MIKRKIFILLLHFSDIGSLAMQYCTDFYYTHASIGLEEDMNTFYSFVYKGFLVEKLTYYAMKEAKTACLLYEIEVKPDVYQQVREQLLAFKKQASVFSYTRIGLLLALLHLPFKWPGHYFCSQFVAEILKKSGAVRLNKRCCLCLPYDFTLLAEAKCCFEGSITGLLHRFNVNYS